jgi:hypothetical protein
MNWTLLRWGRPKTLFGEPPGKQSLGKKKKVRHKSKYEMKIFLIS